MKANKPAELIRNSHRVLLIPCLWLVTLCLTPARSAGAQARLIFPDLVLAGFTNGQERVAIIVNLVPPAQALLPMDWNAPQSLQALHAANRGAAEAVLKTLGADEHKLRFRFDNQAGFSGEVTLGALAKLLSNPQVESIEPVQEVHAHLAQGIPLINALTSRSTYNGSGLAIAICDTGIDYNHPRLGGGGFPNSKVIGGYDFGDSDADPIPNTQAHGTCCAGIAAGDLGTVGDYIGGVAPGARLYACKISYGTTGSAYNDAMIAAWDWCVTHRNDDPANPIMVISTSFGGGQYFSACDSSVTGMTTAANNAVAAGITVLASSGNDGFCDSMGWPACISSVISVGAVYDASFGTYYPCISSASCAPTKTSTTGCATHYYATDDTQADRVTSYANVASFLDVFAPGNQCYTTDISGSTGYSTGDYYDSFGGTSAACPYAAGAVACLQHAAKARTGAYLTPAQVRSRLAAAGDLVTDTKVAITKPRVNLGNTITAIVPRPWIVIDTSAVTGEGCLPTNGVIDPGETVAVSFALKNTGGSDTANVVATLLATNGVTLPSAPQTYGAILAGGAAVTRTFTFTATGACGGNLTAVLQLQDGTNNLSNVTNTFTLGALGAPVLTNCSSGGVSVAIPDNSTVEVPIAITDGGTVADVNVRVRLNHTRDSQLVISLVHPDGTVITLANKRGGNSANYGSGTTDCSGTFTVFDDAAGTSITNGTAPFAGTYKPEQLLSSLNGKSVAGTWKLRVADTVSGRTGTIYCFQLDVTRQVPACCTGTSADLGLVMTDAPDPVTVSSNLTYSLTVTNLGPGTAASVTVTDALPAGVTFLSASVSQGTWATNGGSLFTCALGDVNAIGSATVSIVVRPNSAGSISNIATASSTISDPDTTNNTAMVVTVADVALPTITQPPQPQNVCPGATATLTVAAAGAGPLSWQWQTNNINLTNGGHYDGVTTSNLTVSGADSTVLGNYRCVVSNQGGSTPSSAAALTITDTTPPTITCPPDVTVSATSGCSATNVVLGSPVTGDNCGVAGVTNNGPGSYPLGTNVVIWIVTDTSGNTNSCQQRVVVRDTTPPLLTCASNKTVECGSVWSFDPPNFTDCCGTNVTVSLVGSNSIVLSPCQTLWEGLWQATDCCTNSTVCTQLVMVVDTTAPLLTCAGNKTVECGSAWSFDPPNVTDCCGTNVTVSLIGSNSTVLAPCQTLWEGLWQAMDCCSNSTVCTQLVLVVDTTAPLLTCANNKTVECGSAWSFDPPNVTDCCGTNVTVSLIGSNSTVLAPCQTLWEGLWQAMDCCSNSTVCTQLVLVVDTTAPLLTCASNKTVECGSAWSFDPPNATDCCGTNVTVSLIGSNSTALGPCQTLWEGLWQATDCCTDSTVCTQLVMVVDTTPPLATCASNKTVECGSVWSFDPPNVTDCCGTNVTVSLVGSNSTVLSPCQTLWEGLWRATDCCTNSTVCTQLVMVADTTPPLLTCASNKTVECGSAWSFDPPSASDACAGTNVLVHVQSTETNGSCPQVATRVWIAYNVCSNASATCTQAVTVVGAAPVADFAGGMTNGVAPLTVIFTNLSSGAASYNWDFGDGNMSADANPVNIYSNAGMFSVTLTALGSCGTNTLSLTNYIVVTNPPALLVVSPKGWAFGTLIAGQSTTQAFQVVNAGGLALSGSATSAPPFSVVSGSPFTVPAGQTGGVEVAFSPTEAGTFATNVLFTSNAGDATNAVTGTAVTPGQLAVSPGSVDFGLIPTGVTAQASLVVSNAGGSPLQGTAGLSDIGASFEILAGTPFTLGESGSTNLIIRFAPATPGVFSNAMVFASDGGNSTNSVTGRAVGTVSLLSAGAIGTEFTFSFDTVAGLSYVVQYTDDLTAPAWQVLQTVSGDGTTMTITNSLSTPSQRFYRLSVE